VPSTRWIFIGQSVYLKITAAIKGHGVNRRELVLVYDYTIGVIGIQLP